MSKARLLIVEDEHIVAMDIQNSLERNDYQAVGHVDCGEDAIKLAEELRPDLILMDISLKGEMDGIEAAIQIRERYNIPVIFLTAFANQSTTDRARLAEPYGYLLKPFEERELIITIEMALYKHNMEIKLAESEARFRRLASNAPDIIFRYEISPTMKLTYINTAVEKITRYAPDECYADPNLMFSMIYPEDIGLMANYMQSLTLPDGPLYARWIGKDGVTRWMESRLIPILDASGQMIAVEGITRDITDRKRMEDALRESKERYRIISENMSDFAYSFRFEPNGKIVYEWATESFTKITGYTMAEIEALDGPINLVHPEDRQIALDHIKTLSSGKSDMREYRIITKSGNVIWVKNSARPIWDEAQGRIIQLFGSTQNITERKQAELAERDQRQLAEALRDTAMVLNRSLRLDDVLDRILANICKLVDYDMAMVSFLDGDAIKKIRYQRNPKSAQNQLALGDMHANLLNIPILKTIIDTKRPILVPDIQKDQRWLAVAIPGMNRIRSLICAPVEIQGSVVGIINILSATSNYFTPLHAERISAFASQAAVAMENAQLYEMARNLSLTDPLTGLFNMRYFTDFSQLEFERVRRYERTLSLVMLDIDHFKNVNDTHGHNIGDLTLHEIAARIKNTVRAVDVVARYGGEEFVVLMPETALDEAVRVAERIRQTIAGQPIENDNIAISITASLGAAEIKRDTNSLDEIIKYADKALYKAKGNGRNRVETYSNNE